MPFVMMNFEVLNHESFNHSFCNWARFIHVDFYTRVELNMFLHICSSCDGIGGDVRLIKGDEVKRMSWVRFKFGVHFKRRGDGTR
jgi:hypothetical protein